MLKKIIVGAVLFIGLLVGFVYWFFSLMPPVTPLDDTITPQQLSYIQQSVPENRGKILAVLTSTDTMGESGKATGFELTELVRAYYVFQVNGFEVDIASVKGGEPPFVRDDDEITIYELAFFNDPQAQDKLRHSLAIADVQSDQYQGVYFVGGKGTMWDFPGNSHIQTLVRDMIESDKVVAAVCHGPAALVDVELSDGSLLVEGRQVSSFTNEEELFLMSDAEQVFPFLLESRLRENQGKFVTSGQYLQQVVQDGNLITGQNPWSVWEIAETIIRQLGYEPVARKKTAEEMSMNLLLALNKQGMEGAQALLKSIQTHKLDIAYELLAVHSIVALMQGELIKTVQILRLLASAQPQE